MNLTVAPRAAHHLPVSPVTALEELLQRLRGIIVRLSDEAYVSRPAPHLSGSIGGHVRHCLDHVSVLVTAAQAPQVSYDHRARGTAVESDRSAAVAEIDALLEALDVVRVAPLHRPVFIHALVHRDGAGVFGDSSLGRELAFVTQHTIHHFAIMGLLLDRIGVPVPAGFGLAPSTPQPS